MSLQSRGSEKTHVAALERDLLIVLHEVARTLRIRFDQKARAAHGMTRAQWIILTQLERRPGISQIELAVICEVEPITVGRLVDRLEMRGLVERRADRSDRRIRRLHLLPAALSILRTINDTRAEINAHLTVGLDKPTIDALIDTLLAIKENLADEPLSNRKFIGAGK